jgi:hypothetical protein
MPINMNPAKDHFHVLRRSCGHHPLIDIVHYLGQDGRHTETLPDTMRNNCGAQLTRSHEITMHMQQYRAMCVTYIHTLGPSAKAPDAPQPWAYCATLKCSLSSDSAALCLLCRGKGLLLRLCLFLLVRQTDSQKRCSADEPAPRSSK